MISIDLNCDVGEGVGNEELLFRHISSCNIACGGHAGDDQMIQKCIELAITHQVKIGAHPSYPDRENFGRKAVDISQEALYETLRDQILKVYAFAKAKNTTLHHVKPHGALYNKAAKDPVTAQTIIEVVKSISTDLILYVPYGSIIAEMARAQNTPMFVEGFADRAYTLDYSLVSRSEPNALLTTAPEIVSHILPMLLENKLVTAAGERLDFSIDTLCLHGDTPNADVLIKDVVLALQQNKIHIQ